MKFLQTLSTKVSFLKPPEPRVPGQIFLLSEITNQALPLGILELSKLAKTEKSAIKSTGLVIPNTLIQDFWTHQNLDKKIKNILAGVNLRHPRSISAAAASIERLIMRQTLPISWQEEWKKLEISIQKNPKSTAVVSLYFGSTSLGQVEWLPELSAIATETALAKLLRRSLSALYSERFIREREQRGFGHAHLPVTVLYTFREPKKKSSTPEIFATLCTNVQENVARLTIKNQEKTYHLNLFKPALTTKKSLVLNDWHQSYISESTLGLLVSPLIEIEKRLQKSVIVSGCIDPVTNSFTVEQLNLIEPQSAETKLEYVLQATGPVLGTGKFFGQGIAVGPLAVIRSNNKQVESGAIIVAKNFSSVANSDFANVAGLVLEDGSESAEIKLRTLHVKIPVLLGVKQATKRLRSGVTTTLALLDNVGTLFSGALPYEVKPVKIATKKIKTELRSPDSAIALDDLICEIGNRHPLDYFTAKGSANYSSLLGQKLAETIAKKYPARVTVELSNSVPQVFSAWNGGVKAERTLHLRQSARGAERYLHPAYAEVLIAECAALTQARDKFGLTNFSIQLPYCRSGHELEEMLAALKKQGISRENNWRFILATDVPGHALLTQSLAQHLDELIFDIDSLVKSTTGERTTAITPAGQKTVEIALTAIAKTAAKEQARIALTGTLLSRQPRLVYSAIKSGIKTLVVDENQSAEVRSSIYEAERTVGNTVGTNHQLLGMVAGFACLGALLMTVGAGCGQSSQVPETPQITPAQIRAEIMTALAEEREKSLAETTVTTVSGFADFTVTHPRVYEAAYSPRQLTLTHSVTKENMIFSTLSRFGTTSSTEFVTESNLPGKLFSYVSETVSSAPAVFIYEIALQPNTILKIETSTSSPAIEKVIKSIKTF